MSARRTAPPSSGPAPTAGCSRWRPAGGERRRLAESERALVEQLAVSAGERVRTGAALLADAKLGVNESRSVGVLAVPVDGPQPIDWQAVTTTDIALGGMLGYLLFRFPDIDWRTPYPNLAKHYDKLMQRPSFADTVPQG